MSVVKNVIFKAKYRLFRNHIQINDKKVIYKRVNLEWWDKEINIGDTLAEVIFHWMLNRKKYLPDKKTKKTSHLMTLGSIIGMKSFDATIWGSGLHTLSTLNSVYSHRKYVKYDVRAVRGPITKYILKSNGYNCDKCACGDPAVLMPNIYLPKHIEKKYDCSIIKHLNTLDNVGKQKDFHFISVKTDDYKAFIDEIVASRLIIASSLHGIILAETYNVPAIFINENGKMDNELIKYYDWYYSTERYSVQIATTIEQALTLEPMPIPNLDLMRAKLLESFPYDLWS